MKIAYICISHKPIEAGTTGGIETFSISLLNALRSFDCQISLFAAEETDRSMFPDIEVIPVFSLGELQKESHDSLDSKLFTLNYSLFQTAGFAKALSRNSFDVLHFSCAQWYIPFFFQQAHHSVVTTVHVNNLTERPLQYILHQFSGPSIVNISHASAEPFASYQQKRIIHNGIDLPSFPFIDKKGEYFAWLGRISPVKGLREGLIAARSADVDFIASGSVDFPDYYNKEIMPRLDARRKVIGPLDSKEKSRFLGQSKAVLLPVQWEEPFGLVAIEAMACGTPVIAMRKGGLKEIVVDGVTGYLVDSIEEMAEKMKSVDAIDRQACRRHVEKHFSSKGMARHYFECYHDVMQKGDL